MDKSRSATTPAAADPKAEHERLLEEAMKQPGVREAMSVYAAYSRVQEQLDVSASTPYFSVVSAVKTE